MQQDQQTHEDVQFLTGSQQRPAVLAALCAEPARPHELCADIDATRTTIQRILAGFRERDWVVKRDGDYRATVTGRRIHERYETLVAEAERAQALGPLAVHLGPVADDMPVEAVEASRITVGEDGSPLAPLSRSTQWMQSVEGPLRAISPVVAEPFNDAGAELLRSGTEIEMVIDARVLEQSKENYESDLELGANHDGIQIYVHEEPLSVGIAYDDESCSLGAYDESGNLRAFLESEDDRLREWAQDVYGRYRDQAVPLETLYDDESALGEVER